MGGPHTQDGLLGEHGRLVGLAHQYVQQGTLANTIARNEGNALPFVHSETDIAKQYLRTHRFRESFYQQIWCNGCHFVV